MLLLSQWPNDCYANKATFFLFNYLIGALNTLFNEILYKEKRDFRKTWDLKELNTSIGESNSKRS